jgi:hypothetical protein
VSDIFISYASEDRPFAESLAQSLESKGWSVWWDRVIPIGERFDDVIQEQIEAAACVLVLWSEQSTSSDWVLAEAQEGLDQGKLLPVLVDSVRPPLAFRRLHAADLAGWDGGDVLPAFQKLEVAVTGFAGTPRGSAGAVSRNPGEGRFLDAMGGTGVGGERGFDRLRESIAALSERISQGAPESPFVEVAHDLEQTAVGLEDRLVRVSRPPIWQRIGVGSLTVLAVLGAAATVQVILVEGPGFGSAFTALQVLNAGFQDAFFVLVPLLMLLYAEADLRRKKAQLWVRDLSHIAYRVDSLQLEVRANSGWHPPAPTAQAALELDYCDSLLSLSSAICLAYSRRLDDNQARATAFEMMRFASGVRQGMANFRSQGTLIEPSSHAALGAEEVSKSGEATHADVR